MSDMGNQQPHRILDPFGVFLLDDYSESDHIISSSSNTMHVDWKETSEAHTYEFDLPGITREDVKLELHQGNEIHIIAERKDDEEGLEAKTHVKWHCKERWSGHSFSRRFRLPENAKVDEIKASMRDGVLVLTVPKDKQHNKKHKHKHWSVHISGNNQLEEEEKGHPSKGLGRFVCCKA